ncbi:MAG: hypothetical protein ACTSQE_03655 [Candidatus Heimdallarchaeaceae archaeon]
MSLFASSDKDTTLPDWYVLKKPSDIELDVEEWRIYAEKRLNKFLDEKSDFWTFYRPTWMGENEWREKLDEEVGGHYLLRLAVAKDPRLTSWLVEMEGDLFEFRFVESFSVEEKISVLKDLFGEENVLTISELNKIFGIDIFRKTGIMEQRRRTTRYSYQRNIKTVRKRGGELEKRIAIRYFKVPTIVGAKKVLLYRGWAIVRFADIRLTVKRAFEKKLKKVIEQSKTFVENDPYLNETIKPIREKIAEIAKSSRIKGLSELDVFQGEEIYNKIDCFPPCIYELISILRGKGHLAHMENWQLGTFLKKIGMSVDGQLRFWYENSIDNVGQNFDEFVHKVGYQIKHIYGLTGGGIDYDPPKCVTCIEGYFCYFAHKKLEDISEDIKIRFENKPEEEIDKAIDDITQLIINHRYRQACARYFTLHTGWTIWEGTVRHMLQYTESAYKRFYSNIKEKDHKKEEESNDTNEKRAD